MVRSSLEQNALVAGLLALTFSLQFGLGVLGAPFALVGALLLGIGVTLLWQYFELPATRPWLPLLLVTSSVFISTLVLELAYRPIFAEWFTAAAALLGSGATLAITLSHSSHCNLCNCRLASRDLTFRCPRCSQQVCEQTCWDFEHRRCRLCLEQRVPILPLETSWWTRVSGPRMAHGRCQVCQTSAEQDDLRACPKCRRPQCHSCWDFLNGECGRCACALPDLPVALGNVIQTGLGSETL